MHLCKVFLVFVLWAIIAAPAHAQTGEEVVDRALEALGGEAALEATRSVTVEALASISAASMSMEASLKYINVRPDKLRMEISVASFGMEIVQGTDGKDFWLSTNGTVTDVPSEQIPQFRQNAESILPGLSFKNLRNAGVEFEYVGRETLQGIDVHHIRYPTPADLAPSSQGGEVDWYFSVGTGLPLASMMESTSGPATAWFEDYREVGLVMMPFRWEFEAGGQAGMTVTVQNVQTNKPVEPGLFERPQG